VIVSLIAALAAENRGIGRQGTLPWHQPKDLQRFRSLTMGHALIFGRKTYDSLGGRELPGRRLIVLTRRGLQAKGVPTAPSLEAALEAASGELQDPEPFIGGGGQVFAEALAKDLVGRMFLTLVHGQVPADVFFPEYPAEEWKVTEWEEHPADQSNPLPMTFQTLERTHSRATARPA
jgi:dihydrofolate reductase